MSSLKPSLKNLKAGQLHTFHGGIHPPERKSPANLTPISEAGLPEELVLQVRQHIGQAAQLSVSVGEQVLKGQALTEPLNPMMVPVHAPTSGIISAIEDRPLCHPSGLSGLCIVLKPDGQERWRARFPVADYQLLEPDVLLTRLHQAGITGLGGAGFPAHVKLAARKPAPLINQSNSPVGASAHAGGISTLIINGVECEPYISADDRLMREHAGEILQGIAILRHIVRPKLTILAVEDNKPEALAALQAAHLSMQEAAAQLSAADKTANQDDSVQIIAIPTKYPSGGEKQLIEVLTGLQVPHQGLPSDLGIVMQNVGTVYAIQQAIIDDEPLIRRVVTLAGEAFATPGNAWVYLGTPVRYLLKRYGLTAEREQRIIMGGPMMGFTLHSAAAPIIKGSNCILAPKYAELAPPAEEMPCIRCSLCADACPASLLPQQLYWYARSEEHDKLESHNLFDCIECGACAYVCPSNIPLVEYYRIAKADIRHARHEADQAERAKIRFEARQERLAVEKAERQTRQAKAAADRKARMAEQATKTGVDPVAAALARVKARQLAETADGLTAAPDDMTALRAARKEEAKRNRALKAAQAAGTPAAQNIEQSVTKNAAQSVTQSADAEPASESKNPAVVAALARAKARRAAAAATTAAEQNTDTAAIPTKNPAVAAAIAKAKAAHEREHTQPRNERVDHKKAAIKAAVARAKARQEAELQAAIAALNPTVVASEAPVAGQAPIESTAVTENNAASENTPQMDTKKAAIQAAVARAKARKAAQSAAEPKPVAEAQLVIDAKSVASDDETISSASESDPAAAKQAAIKAAVARAKARKAALSATEPKPVAEAQLATDANSVASDNETISSASESDPAAAKQAAIKAAVARAKARKAAQTQSATDAKSVASDNETISSASESDPAAAKQAAIKAAVARAKARQAAKAAGAQPEPPSDPLSASLSDKKEDQS